MSRRTQEDLDVRIRRAWPIDCDTTSSPPTATQRMRTRIDERIVSGAEPDASHRGAPSRRTVGARSRRHVATVLAGAVVAASVLAVGGLVTGRLGLVDQPDPVEFADQPAPGATDQRTEGVSEDPDAHVRTAIAATRHAAAALTVQEALRQWEEVDTRHLEDIDAFAEQTTPAHESTAVRTASGDWSYTNWWDDQSGYTGPIGAVRFVGGRYYERGVDERTWEHVATDDGRRLSELVRDGLVMGGGGMGATVLDGSTIVDLLAPYDAGWTVVPDGPAGATRYRMADTGKATRLAMELETTKPLTREAASDLPIVTEGETTVDVWIDNETGLVQRVLAQRSAEDDATEQAWVMRRDFVLAQGEGSQIAAPERATDVSLDEWCARDRAPIWRMAKGWQKVCGQS